MTTTTIRYSTAQIRLLDTHLPAHLRWRNAGVNLPIEAFSWERPSFRAMVRKGAIENGLVTEAGLAAYTKAVERLKMKA